MKTPLIRCNATLVVSFVLTTLAACGWGIYVVGFGIRTTWNETVIEDTLNLEHTCVWAVSISGPVLFLFALLIHHLIFKAITSVIYLSLMLFYFAVSACVLKEDIGVMYGHFSLGLEVNYGFHIILEFVGVALSLVFLSLSVLVQFTFLTRYFNKPTKFTYDPS